MHYIVYSVLLYSVQSVLRVYEQPLRQSQKAGAPGAPQAILSIRADFHLEDGMVLQCTDRFKVLWVDALEL